jgi:hypothetical protein
VASCQQVAAAIREAAAIVTTKMMRPGSQVAEVASPVKQG